MLGIAQASLALLSLRSSVVCCHRLTMQNRGLARASQACLNLAERKRFRGRKNIGPDIREFVGRRTRRGVNPSFLPQRYYRIFWCLEIMISSYKFVQVRRCRLLIMSEKKVFPFTGGTRRRYQHKSLPKTCAERCGCKRNSLTTGYAHNADAV